MKIATGIFMWDGEERKTNRYGVVYPAPTNFDGTVHVNPSFDAVRFYNKRVRLTVKVLETRTSGHAGDAFLDIKPSTPDAGEVVDLGVGTLRSAVNYDGNPALMLEPGDGREELWIDPRKFYRLHDQTVEFYVEETADDFTPAPQLTCAEGGAIMNDDGTFQVKHAEPQEFRMPVEMERLGPGTFSVKVKPPAQGGRLPKRRDRGFTLTELFIFIWMLLGVAAMAAAGYAAVHFIAKYW
jgi:hypothetical protein